MCLRGVSFLHCATVGALAVLLGCGIVVYALFIDTPG